MRLRRLAALFLSALLICSTPIIRQAVAQEAARICIPVYNASTGGMECVEGWVPKLLNSLSNTVTSVKSNASGSLGLIYCYNPNSSASYIQIFDVATAAGVTLGSTVPNLSFGIPATQSSGSGPTAVGIEFLHGIQVAATTTATGSTAPSTALDCSATFD